MEEESLDLILLDQLHSARNGQKLIKRIKQLFKKDPNLDALEHQNKVRIEFFENMIEDKELLNQKNKKKPQRESDLLSKNPMLETYRFAMFASLYGYTVMLDTMKNYISYFKKDDNEKNNN